AVLHLLPHRLLPHPAQGALGSGVPRRGRALRGLLPDHAAAGQTRTDLDRSLQLPGAVEPVPAAAGAEPAAGPGTLQLRAQPGPGLPRPGRALRDLPDLHRRALRRSDHLDGPGAGGLHRLPTPGAVRIDRRRPALTLPRSDRAMMRAATALLTSRP